MINLHKAEFEEAATLAQLAARTFRDAFGAQNNPLDLEQYISVAFSLEKMEEELSDPASTFYIAHDDDKPAGYIKLRTSKKPDCIDDAFPIELERIYVDQPYLGKGVGSALMKRALEEGQKAGFKTIWLGVWKKNEKAVAFYLKWGYQIIGEHEFIVGNDVQYDHIMIRSLNDAG